jgi:hypothetical protein
MQILVLPGTGRGTASWRWRDRLKARTLSHLDETTAMPQSSFMYTVVETPTFLASAAKAGMTDREWNVAIDLIAANPDAGEIMPGGGRRRSQGSGAGTRLGQVGRLPCADILYDRG